MICGAMPYIVELKLNGTKHQEFVTARTPAAARKVIRAAYGHETKIISVRRKRRHTKT